MTGAKPTSPILALLTRLTRLDGIISAALTTSDGLPIAATGEVASGELVDLRSATTAAIFGAVNRALPGLGLGEVHAATIETTRYSVHLRGFQELVLSAIGDRTVDRAAVDRELDRIADVLSWVKRSAKGT